MIERHIWKIIRESIGILAIASIISSFGGIGLEKLGTKLAWLLPILILLPALNNMIGSFGTIIASRFTTMLYEKEIKEKKWWKEPELHHLFFVIIGIAAISSIYVSVLAYFIAVLKGFQFDIAIAQKIIFITIVTTLLLVIVLFLVSIIGGFYVYRKKHDPDNYLIPLSTALADFGSMALLSLLVAVMF
jgi:cation transporter-like permease